MTISYAPQMPPGYWTEKGRSEFGDFGLVLHHEHFGMLDWHETEAEAAYAAQEHAAEMQAAEEAEAEHVALTVEAAQIELPGHVIDFLHALDRGDFGTAHRFGDGTESAYVAALRTAVAPFAERRA